MIEPLPPALRTLFDRVATHFPGHTMQRVRSPEGRIRYTYASPGMRETFGLDPRAIISQDPATHDWVHVEDRQRFIDAVEHSALTLTTLDEEARVIGHDGHLKWVRSIGYPRRLRDGTTVWDGIAIDVSDRREAAAILERALQLAKETEEAQARLIGSDGFRSQLTDIKTMIDELATRVAEPISGAIISTLQQAVVAILLKIDARNDFASMPTEELYRGYVRAMPQYGLGRLSTRQKDVFVLMARGLTNRAIAEALGIGEGTAKLHVAAILKKLGAGNRTQAVLMHSDVLT